MKASRNYQAILYGKSQDAMPSMEYCPMCTGYGVIPDSYNEGEFRTCPQCDGTEKIRKPGDDKACDLILRIVEMTRT